MIQLSFSTINNCLQPENSHNWLNKQMGLKPEDKWYYHEGKEAHKIIQGHVCGRKQNDKLSHIKTRFPIVEHYDFDPKTKFGFDLTSVVSPMELGCSFKNIYKIIGFIDGKDRAHTKFLEIKSSSTPWSLSKFQKSMQRKLYALSDKNFTESYLITCKRKEEEWENDKPKLFQVPVTDEDRQEAVEWIIKAVKTIEDGKFSGGLDENGKCTDPWCYFGNTCSFKTNAV